MRFDCVYFGRALRAMEERLRTRDLTVYLTWDLRELPTYGDDVVAVVLGDEESRRPVYADSVRAVFKCSGERPWIGSALLRRRTYLSLLIFLQGARRWLRHLPDDLRVLRRRLQGRRPRPVEHLPLGFYNQLDLPLTDFDARRTAVFFAGSLERMQRSRLSPRRWLRMPKSVARQEMLDALAEYQRRRPEVPVNLRLTPSFASTTRADAARYSRELMDARVCLAPRGTNAETYRFFEGLRYGCVVVTERLPPTGFYAGAPAIVVDRWRDLPDILERLLDDPAELRRRHQRSLAWWRDRCSEAATGALMAERVDAWGAE